jgi:glutathione S-transferase
LPHGKDIMALTLYELGGLNDRRYSLFSWRARYALAHKGLTPEYRPVRVSDKAAIGFSKQDKVPILIDGDETIHDSFRIAQHLEARYPDKPLFGGEIGQSLSRFMNSWVDRTIVPRLVPLLVIDVLGIIDEGDGAHMRRTIEKAFGGTLEELAANREKDVAAIRRLLDPVRASLRSQPFICGSQPAYADYIAFSPLQWARIVSPAELLEPGDALVAWRERMLDLHGGLGRTMPARA